MKIAVTAMLDAPPHAPIVLRGPYDGVVPKAARLGYDAIELHIHDSADLDRRKLTGLLKENGIALSSIGTGSAYSVDGLSLSSGNSDIRQRAIQRIRDHIVTAGDHGAVVIIGLMKGVVRECGSRTDFLRNLNGSLDTLLKSAEEHRVALVIEILNRYESDILNTIDEGVDYLERFDSDYLKLHIDTFHMNIEEADIPQSIRRARGRIGHCHIADSDRWYAGHGHYDFPQTVAALTEIGYTGALAVESLIHPNSEESARLSYQTLRSSM